MGIEDGLENGYEDAHIVFVLNHYGDENAGLGKYKDTFMRILSVLKLSDKRWRYQCIKGQTEFSILESFKAEVMPGLVKSPPELVITFGPDAAYSFLKGTLTSKKDWFDEAHTRLHKRKKPGTQDPFFIYCLPSFHLCVEDEVIREVCKTSLIVIRGLISELDV